MLLFPTLSKTSARWPTVALLPSCCFHEIKRAFALSRLVLYSSSRLWIFDAEMNRFEPTTRQQVPTSSLMSESCNSVTSSFLGSGIVPKKMKKTVTVSYYSSEFYWTALRASSRQKILALNILCWAITNHVRNCIPQNNRWYSFVSTGNLTSADRLTFCQPIRKCWLFHLLATDGVSKISWVECRQFFSLPSPLITSLIIFWFNLTGSAFAPLSLFLNQPLKEKKIMSYAG